MTASNESPTVRGPYVPRQHRMDPTIPVVSIQPNAEFQHFLMWKQQQEFHQWQQQQQQQQFAAPTPTYPNQQQNQWSSTVTSPNISPSGHQYQQFLQYQQHSQQQQPGNHNKQPSNYNESSAATSNGYSRMPQATVPMNTSNGQVQTQQSVAALSNAIGSNSVAVAPIATPSVSPNTGTATNGGSTSCNAVSNTDTSSNTDNANSTSSSGSGCFNPVTSLINLMGVATNTMNNVTATNQKTTTSLESMKKAFSGMMSTFQGLGGQIPGIGGCVNL